MANQIVYSIIEPLMQKKKKMQQNFTSDEIWLHILFYSLNQIILFSIQPCYSSSAILEVSAISILGVLNRITIRLIICELDGK